MNPSDPVMVTFGVTLGVLLLVSVWMLVITAWPWMLLPVFKPRKDPTLAVMYSSAASRMQELGTLFAGTFLALGIAGALLPERFRTPAGLIAVMVLVGLGAVVAAVYSWASGATTWAVTPNKRLVAFGGGWISLRGELRSVTLSPVSARSFPISILASGRGKLWLRFLGITIPLWDGRHRVYLPTGGYNSRERESYMRAWELWLW